MPELEIVRADLTNVDHQNAVVAMMDAYASDPMGDGKPMSRFARANLINSLRNLPTTLIYHSLHKKEPRGMAVCFRGFSTFAAMPLINLHDLYIDVAWRGRGIGISLLDAVEREARDTGCCKLTLEVQENNTRARSIYDRFGFRQGVYVAEAGGTLFMTKLLT